MIKTATLRNIRPKWFASAFLCVLLLSTSCPPGYSQLSNPSEDRQIEPRGETNPGSNLAGTGSYVIQAAPSLASGSFRQYTLEECIEIALKFNLEIQAGRKSRNKLVNVSANVAGRSLGEVVSDIRRETDKISLPIVFNIEFEGAVKRMTESFANLLKALFLAVVFTYILHGHATFY